MNDNRELDRLNNVQLASGAHTSWQQGACLMEAVAYVAGEPHSDHPVCASPVLGSFGRSLNDVLPDHLRQDLKPLVPLLIGTAGDGHDETRSLMALDWLVRTWLPAWLQLAHLDAEAGQLRVLAQIVDLETAQAAGPIVRTAQKKANAAGGAARGAAGGAAGDAAWDAAGAAAWDAARAAARAAAGAAARAAAWDAAGAAAWAAAWDAAGDAAWDAARAAARDAAWDAAWDAARDAAGAAAWAAARDAAWDAARAHLAPTVTGLQRSAIALFGRMITGGTSDSAVTSQQARYAEKGCVQEVVPAAAS